MVAKSGPGDQPLNYAICFQDLRDDCDCELFTELCVATQIICATCVRVFVCDGNKVAVSCM